MATVYILHSQYLNRYYTGFTTNLALRLDFHAHAESRKFTANADDWELYLTIECDTKEQGLAIEAHIKRMKSKRYIDNLKCYPELVEKLKSQYQ